ncbi:MAG: formylglycine-generating enzyme family protein [Myxococcota bacterium]|nr:formylglycine-generating enzyme family protein [Myxococcota bacterium]
MVLAFVECLWLLGCAPTEQSYQIVPENPPEPAIEPESTPEVTVTDDRFLRLAAAAFWMGSPLDEEGRSQDEDLHEVIITRDFMVLKTEVTQEMFLDVMGYNPAWFSDCGLTCPVENVSWSQAADYCNTLSISEDKEECYECIGEGEDIECRERSDLLIPPNRIQDCRGYRLLTEAEWEYAARGGSASAIWTPLGGGEIPAGQDHNCESELTLSDGTPLVDLAWYCANADAQTHPVAEKLPNDFGLYDIRGNVWEWVNDRYGFYSDYDYNEDPTGSSLGDHRILRGGRWGNEPYALRAAKRIHLSPDYKDGNFGFRIAMTVME